MKEIEKRRVSKRIEENIAYLKPELGVGKSFDVIQLNVEYAERKMTLFFIDGLVKDDILHLLMKFLTNVKKEQLEPDVLHKLVKTYIPYVEVELTDDLDKAIDTVLAGPTALVVDGIEKIILIDLFC